MNPIGPARPEAPCDSHDTPPAPVATRCHAGIGSRRTPAEILTLCEQIAETLADRGWRLRSGHAPGADQAFERGAAGNADIFLPWDSFENATPVLGQRFSQPTGPAYELASDYHPNWLALRRGPRALHARNCHQILGVTLDQPASFAICWTPDGSLDGHGPHTGGTGQALRLCTALRIPVFNLARPEHLARIRDGLALDDHGSPSPQQVAGEHQPRVYSRRKDAPTPPVDAVYVGRPTIYGNPFTIGRDGNRETVIARYEKWLHEREQAQLRCRAIQELRGRDLVCWCAPAACHADILLAVVNDHAQPASRPTAAPGEEHELR